MLSSFSKAFAISVMQGHVGLGHRQHGSQAVTQSARNSLHVWSSWQWFPMLLDLLSCWHYYTCVDQQFLQLASSWHA